MLHKSIYFFSSCSINLCIILFTISSLFAISIQLIVIFIVSIMLKVTTKCAFNVTIMLKIKLHAVYISSYCNMDLLIICMVFQVSNCHTVVVKTSYFCHIK